jgi:hypothetical protein
MSSSDDCLSDADVAAVFERLRADVRQGVLDSTSGDSDDDRVSQILALPGRDDAERLWVVTAERPLVRRPGLKGAIAYPVKFILRPFLRWYVEPPFSEQRQFNLAALRLIDGLAKRVQESEPTAAGQDDECVRR